MLTINAARTAGGIANFFFDRARVIEAMDRATVRSMSRVGAFIRTRARTSIRKRRGISESGSPPHSHIGTLRGRLFFAYDPDSKSVVVGPEKLGKGEAPSLLEYGGTATRSKVLPRGGRPASPAQAAAFRRKVVAGEITVPPRQKITYTAKYAARPYMGPALDAELSAGTIPEQWRDSLRR